MEKITTKSALNEWWLFYAQNQESLTMIPYIVHIRDLRRKTDS